MTDYPAEVHIPRTEPRRRLWAVLAILAIKLVAIVPHLVVLLFLNIARFVVFIVAQFAVLFTGSYPEGMHRFVTAVIRWEVRVSSFFLSLTDKYPPFSLQPGGDYPVDYAAHRPERSSRLFAGFTILVLFAAVALAATAAAFVDEGFWNDGGSGSGGWLNLRYIATIPHYIVLWFFGIAVFVVWVITQFVILFTGKTNAGMNNFMELYVRWWGRVQAFVYGLTDKYPPFSGSPGPAEEAALGAQPLGAQPIAEPYGGPPTKHPPDGPPQGGPPTEQPSTGPNTGELPSEREVA